MHEDPSRMAVKTCRVIRTPAYAVSLNNGCYDNASPDNVTGIFTYGGECLEGYPSCP